ncbi:methyl-CpG-binding domain-containing protein 4, partial [Metarhizium majus ARSEF 297]
MSSSFGASVLSTFDCGEDGTEFLSQLIESPDTPAHETRQLVDTSILANSDDFHYLIECARSIQQSRHLPYENLNGNDLLSFVWHILTSEPTVPDTEEKPWAETDRLILLAKELAKDPDIRGPSARQIASYTSGQAAIPVFYKVKERFPSPTELRDPNNAEELFSMIRHLGLAANRLAFIQKYAEVFISNPPAPGKQYKVRNYERREFLPSAMSMESLDTNGDSKCLNQGAADDEANAMAWEIGHMTQGKYTLDSWRIFCRDELLGRAQDWNGKGRQPEFQPEWMRVLPHDKELRAYLRWMWMREGWEWNPETGERQVLRPELEAAVNEGRVEYDNAGGLRILETARR